MKIFFDLCLHISKKSCTFVFRKIKIMLNAEPDSNTSPKGMGKEL